MRRRHHPCRPASPDARRTGPRSVVSSWRPPPLMDSSGCTLDLDDVRPDARRAGVPRAGRCRWEPGRSLRERAVAAARSAALDAVAQRGLGEHVEAGCRVDVAGGALVHCPPVGGQDREAPGIVRARSATAWRRGSGFGRRGHRHRTVFDRSTRGPAIRPVPSRGAHPTAPRTGPAIPPRVAWRGPRPVRSSGRSRVGGPWSGTRRHRRTR